MNPWHAPDAVDKAWVQPVKDIPKNLRRSVNGVKGKIFLRLEVGLLLTGTMLAPQRAAWSILGAVTNTADLIMTGNWLNFFIPNIGGAAIKYGLKRTGINDNASERIGHLSSNEIYNS